jgi:hypothetical protein
VASIDDILAAARNPQFVRIAVARVLLRQDLLTRHADLTGKLEDLLATRDSIDTPAGAAELAAEIGALEAEMEAERVEFRFAALSRRDWADLLRAHPPTKEQRQQFAGRTIDHNPETFPHAAIAASCADPKMTAEQVAELEAVLLQSQFDLLWAKCLEANLGGAELPKSLAAGRIRQANGASSTTARNAESRGASSSVDA